MTKRKRLGIIVYAPALVGNDRRALDSVHGMERALPGLRLEWRVTERRRLAALPQRDAWLAGVAARCRRHGALLILDEVISGFRVGRGGMAEALALAPDLVTFGKVIGGGFPVAAYAGRKALMDLVAPVGPVYQAGTLSANPVGMRAGLASLKKIESHDGWRVLNERTARFADGLRRRFAEADPALQVVQHASIFWIVRHAGDLIRRPDRIPSSHADWYRRFFHAALDRGVYLAPSAFEAAFMSAAHSDDDVASTLDRLDDAMKVAV